MASRSKTSRPKASGRKATNPEASNRPTAAVRDETSPSQSPQAQPLAVLTIGHSTRPIDEFLSILQAHGVEQLVDVRTIPKSRRVPQFNQEALAASLKSAKIRYIHLKALGGLRHPKKDSINLGWRNASFRGYADYMATAEFRDALNRLLDLARTKRTVIMCAEAVPWRCHRSLIGDALLACEFHVEDIFSATLRRPHEMTPFARVYGTDVTYPASTEKAGNRQQELPLG